MPPIPPNLGGTRNNHGKKMNQLPSEQNPTAYLEDGLRLGYVVNNHGEYNKSPFCRRVGPLPNGLFVGLKKLG